MNRRRKQKHQGWIIAMIVGLVLLALCAGIVTGLNIGRSIGRKEQQKADEQILQEGLQTSAEELQSQRAGSGGDQSAVPEAESENASVTRPETETALESETRAGSELETALESETRAGSEPESEFESESESETESETESESETETAETEKPLVVAIDPGHQGSWVDMSEEEPNGPGSSVTKPKCSTGTQGSYSNLYEYELTLDVSLQLRTELEARGYEVIMTREDNDAAISNAERAQLAYEEGGDIYVRIHANGWNDSSVNGALAMVPSATNPYVGDLAEDSLLLAQCILDDYCAKTPFVSQGIQYADDMTGINWSSLPVMILEMGYMTNQSDDLNMADAQVQQRMVEGIADGIDDYFLKKGLRTQEASEEDQAKLDAIMENLDKTYITPAEEAGEQWAVSIMDLKTGAAGAINGDVEMKSASVIKAFIMATVYDRVCYPSSEDRMIYYPESYDGELRSLISDMITVSDNTAANTIVTQLGGGDAAAGREIVNQFCEENGYEHTSLGRAFLESNPTGDNYTSANDCMNLLASIYNGTCANSSEASEKMLEFLRQQTRTGKIPAGLTGTAATVANKTGELNGDYGDYVENDIAIIDDGTNAYVLCVMSQNLQDNGTAISRISEISKSVYEQIKQ